ncbi:hypothetical protein CFP56_019576 [Quercus suber]|uniref:Uncharacterized protein n=1 Tax=Quercus suber TaxID=58331 RepID=A0AAW0KGZ9_QUESU
MGFLGIFDDVGVDFEDGVCGGKDRDGDDVDVGDDLVVRAWRSGSGEEERRLSVKKSAASR